MADKEVSLTHAGGWQHLLNIVYNTANTNVALATINLWLVIQTILLALILWRIW